jgi:hypothetical protein
MHAWLDLHAAQHVAGGPAGDAHVVRHLVAAGALQEHVAPRGRGRVGDHAAVARRLRGRALRLVAEEQRRALRAVRPSSLPAPRPLRPLRHGRMLFGGPAAGRARELEAPGPRASTQLSAAQQQRSVPLDPQLSLCSPVVLQTRQPGGARLPRLDATYAAYEAGRRGSRRTGSTLPEALTATGLQNQPVACVHHTSPTAADGGAAGALLGPAGVPSVGPNICPFASAARPSTSTVLSSTAGLQKGCRAARILCR